LALQKAPARAGSVSTFPHGGAAWLLHDRSEGLAVRRELSVSRSRCLLANQQLLAPATIRLDTVIRYWSLRFQAATQQSWFRFWF